MAPIIMSAVDPEVESGPGPANRHGNNDACEAVECRQMEREILEGPPPIIKERLASLRKRKKRTTGTDEATGENAAIRNLPLKKSPLPPNWEVYANKTAALSLVFKTFPVSFTSQEYKTIEGMMSPVPVKSIRKIVNPELWRRYAHEKKEMLLNKSDAQKHPQLKTSYSTNEVLLFHCTRRKTNVEQILFQGLDDRLSKPGCSGKGLYFADDPEYSIRYDGCDGVILIFGVLLGDCLCVDHLPYKERHSLVREPLKGPVQKRKFSDRCFDSITSRHCGNNEYIIFNRARCVPLYEVRYEQFVECRCPSCVESMRSYAAARKTVSVLSWKYDPEAKCDMPNPAMDQNHQGSPFSAAKLFEKMGAPKSSSSGGASPGDTTEDELNDSDLFDYCDSSEEDDEPFLKRVKLMMTSKPQKGIEMKCRDCDTKYDSDHFQLCQSMKEQSSSSSRCVAQLCRNCVQRISMRSMSGVPLGFHCHFCGELHGAKVGNCPDGEMKVRVVEKPHPHCDTIRIQYLIQSGNRHYNKFAYLPDTPEGNQVLELLKTAWERRATFDFFGEEKDRLDFSIPHKERAARGDKYGYPDPEYLQKVRLALKKYGIEVGEGCSQNKGEGACCERSQECQQV